MTERVVFSLGAGASLASVLVFALCAAGLARTPWLIAAVLCAAAAAVLWRAVPAWPVTRPLAWSEWALFWAIAIPFCAVYAVNAAAPEISPDGAFYHLGLVRRYLNQGGFGHITTNLFASFPQAVDMLFLAAYAVGRHSAAALVHCAFLFALPAAMIAWGRRAGYGWAAAAAALVVFVSPVVGVDGSSAYVDVALAFAGFLAFYALELWSEEPGSYRLLIAAGAFAGLAFASKYTGVSAVIYAVAYVTWRGRALRSALVPRLAVLVCAAAFVCAPWLVKNWVTVANPLSPFFNRLFPNPYIHPAFESELNAAMRHFGGHHIGWTTPLELSVRGGILQGLIGPIFVAMPLAFLQVEAAGRRLLVAAIWFALPWFSNLGTRFLIPALPFLALAWAIAMLRFPRALKWAAVINAILCWPWVVNLYADPASWRLTRFPLTAALRIMPEQEFFDHYAPEVRFAALLNANVPPGGVVYTALPLMMSYTDREVWLNYAAALNARIEDTLRCAVLPALQPATRLTFHFDSQRLERLRLTATNRASDWNIHEIEGASGPAQTDLNPWDAALAADGRLATSWRAWQPVMPGNYFEFRLTKPADIGSISLRTRSAEPGVRLDAQLASGQWRTLASPPTAETVALAADLRAEASEELVRVGITHVFLHDREPLGPDFAAHPDEWRARAVAAAPPMRLYALRGAGSIDTQLKLRNNTR